jgi:hypothetical protein
VVHAPLPKDDPVRRNPNITLGEESPGSLVVEIPWDKQREERTSVDENALHRSFS